MKLIIFTLLKSLLRKNYQKKATVTVNQGFGSVSGSGLIRVAGSGSAFKLWNRIEERKMTHKNRKKSRIFMFVSTGCSLLRAEGFSCSLGVLY
jgi:hypothetical protein